MKSKIIILAARDWSLVDDKTGETRTGTSIQYVMSDTLSPVRNSMDGSSGYTVIKESISVECARGLKDVPGVYEAEMVLRAQGGKNVLHINSLIFLSPLNMLE